MSPASSEEADLDLADVAELHALFAQVPDRDSLAVYVIRSARC
jgi:hypothetical protein